MKKLILIFISILYVLPGLQAQMLQKNGISVFAGYGFSESSHTIQSFSIGYQREITGKLYVLAEFTGIQGSQSFKEIFGEFPQLSQYHEFGQEYSLGENVSESLFGRLLDVNTFSLGLKKYIQISPKAYMAGSLSIASNSVSAMEAGGIEYDSNGKVLYDNVYPTYGSYQKFGAKVGLEGLLFIRDNIALNSKVEYLSVLSIVRLSIGTTITF